MEIGGDVSTKIILLFSLALDKTYVFKISFATMPHALGAHTGSDIFHFVVFFGFASKYLCQLGPHEKPR